MVEYYISGNSSTHNFSGCITAGPDSDLWFTESDGNKIGKISPANNKVKNYIVPVANAGLSSITAGPDGNLWFTVFSESTGTSGNLIGKISPTTGKVTEYAIPTTNANPGTITSGPDGDLWFTETCGIKSVKYPPKQVTLQNTPFLQRVSAPAALHSALTVICGSQIIRQPMEMKSVKFPL